MFIFIKKKGSWVTKLWGILLLFCIFPLISFAGIDIVELLPNPTGDDSLGEHIEIRNTGCNIVDIGGYHISDASNKTYTFPNSTMIAPHENIRLPYSITKIALNNSGIESVTLTDSGGVILDSYEYSGTQRDGIVIEISWTDENCELIPLPDTNTGTIVTDTGIVDSGSTNTGDIYAGSLIENNTGDTDTGSTNMGDSIDSGSTSTGAELSIPEIAGMGTTDTGSTTETGISDTGSLFVGVIFPDIFPTIQHPTNAVFSSGIFDCSGLDPCRINITFDPIFTGGLLAKNYSCEVITDTGSILTYNPNTFYFSTGSFLSFRLTSKIDPSQSMNLSWGIIFDTINSTDSQSIQDSGIEPGTGNEDISTGITNSGTMNSGIIFPDIIPVFQNYTNTTNSGDILTCTTSPCRVNFTLEPIFTGAYLEKNYTCEIQYGTGIYNSCNPPQLYPSGTGAIDITITHKISGEQLRKTLQIIQNIPSQNTGGSQGTMSIVTDINPPIAILEFDGKLKSYHEQIGEYEMNCYTMTCAINLTAEKSYDNEGGKISFLWYYGPGDIKTTKDPGERKYGIGDHQIWFRVIDASGNMSEIRYYIHVLGEKDQIISEKTRKQGKVKEAIKAKKESKKIKKPKKPKKITFFDPPKIVLQNSKFVEQDNGYICYTNSKNCSLNLALSGSQKGIIYKWIYEDGETLVTNNPRSRSLKPGQYTIRLIAGYSTDAPLWNQEIQVTVIKTRKPKKIKKAKISKIVHMSGSIINQKDIKNETQDTTNEQNSEDSIPYTTLALIGGIMPIIILRRVLTGVIWKI